MRVVVTGGAGFIGANLCRALVERPDVTEVVALDDLSTGLRGNLGGSGVTLTEGSILDADLVDCVVAGVDAVVHLAARPSVPRSLADPMASHQVNATGTMTVLEAARRHGAQVVTASSSSVYGANPELPKHEDLATRPLSPYAASKLATEAYTLAYGHSFGLPVVAFRFFNVYGPLQSAGHAYAAVVPAFIDAALRGEPLVVHGDGKQTRDFTYVGTVVDVLTQSVLRGMTDVQPINLAFGTRHTLLELIALLEDVMDCRVAVQHVEARNGDVRDSQASSARLAAVFPEAQPIPLSEGLARTVDWFRSR